MPRVEKYLHVDSASHRANSTYNRALIIFLSGSRTSYVGVFSSPLPPSRRNRAPARRSSIDKLIYQRWARDEATVGGIKPSVIYKGRRAHSALSSSSLSIAFIQIATRTTNSANTGIFSFSFFKAIPFFRLTFVLYVTNIDLYVVTCFEKFRLKHLVNDFYAVISPLF